MPLIISDSGIPVPNVLNTAHEDSTAGTLQVVSSLLRSAFGNRVDSGSTTADTFPVTPQIDISGDGQLFGLAVGANNNTSKTFNIKLTIDGVDLYNLTTPTVAQSNIGFVLVGGWIGSSGSITTPIRFKSSLQVSVSTSVTETDGLFIKYSAAYRA